MLFLGQTIFYNIIICLKTLKLHYFAVLVETGLVETGLVETGLVETGLVETGLVETGLVETGLVETGYSQYIGIL